MPTTSNFGWTTPADTDLVKDGAAAIRTLGNGIDTSLLDLKGGTTGQVLAKASNTDLDFTWSSVDPLTILDAKGDLISATAADAPARLAVGTNGQVLTADSSTSTGLKWATPSALATGWSLLNSGGTLLTGATTITVSGISAKEILVLYKTASSANNSADFTLRINGDTNNNYSIFGQEDWLDGNADTGDLRQVNGYSDQSAIFLGRQAANGLAALTGAVYIDKADSTGWKRYHSVSGASTNNATGARRTSVQGFYEASAAITSISIISSTGNFDDGIIYVLGAN